MQREYTTIELASNYAGNNIHLTHDVNNAEGIYINIVTSHSAVNNIHLTYDVNKCRVKKHKKH